jgi:hypothetical protein
MTPKKTPEANQMNLLFCDSKPMPLPANKQRSLQSHWLTCCGMRPPN